MSTFAAHPYAAFLHQVDKPARYTGGEAGEVRKDWASVDARICLAFPDVYDIGMSHLGYKILYKILNDDPRTLAERCYAPWIDMEAELRRRGLPLVSLETARPLSEFDVVGLSLQFELTYTNCLTILDLGGIPLRAKDRSDADPLVLGGGPTATHPEPLAPFFDAFVVGDGEQKLTEVALTWVECKRKGMTRRQRLEHLARLGGVYVPSLYSVRRDPDTGLEVVDRDAAALESLPLPVRRAQVVDLKEYPFPTDGPIGGPEAIFDRMSIEIARGCTEGCRFCQAGMIYRPVRERDPHQIVASVVRSVRESGYDEVSLTSLSTADYSCISPLIHRIGDELVDDKVAVGVSSLRAYGLGEDLLDRIASVRATGLTFAPEAGTQRMRDVINKNVTEEQLLETAHRLFSRSWSRMKLYFMIGLPTEADEDVIGIVETSAKALGVGRKLIRGRAKVTVSVSCHVPKPHTPFQWCAMDTEETLHRKQGLLSARTRAARLDLRLHSVHESMLEGVFARGDRALADVIEHAWRSGARFDSWQDQLRLPTWRAAFEACGIDPNRYLGTLPLKARLPWDHVDVGLAEGFLAKEHEKALAARLSPPCGKQYGRLVHPTCAEEAKADQRPLVCYDCGVGCDLSRVREERIGWLTSLAAPKAGTSAAPRDAANAPPRDAANAPPRDAANAAPRDAAGEPDPSVTTEPTPADAPRRRRQPSPAPPRTLYRYRFQFEKLGPAALLGHLDLVRAIPRIGRRAGMKLAYSQGFHPKPYLSFSPALSLGTLSLAEYVDLRLLEPMDPEAAALHMNEASPRGLRFQKGIRLNDDDRGITQVLRSARYWMALFPSDGHEARETTWWEERLRSFLERKEACVDRWIDGRSKPIDVRSFVLSAELGSSDIREKLPDLGVSPCPAILDVVIELRPSGGVRMVEVLQAIAGDREIPNRTVRAALHGGPPDALIDPLDLANLRSAPSPCPQSDDVRPEIPSADRPEIPSADSPAS